MDVRVVPGELMQGSPPVPYYALRAELIRVELQLIDRLAPRTRGFYAKTEHSTIGPMIVVEMTFYGEYDLKQWTCVVMLRATAQSLPSERGFRLTPGHVYANGTVRIGAGDLRDIPLRRISSGALPSDSILSIVDALADGETHEVDRILESDAEKYKSRSAATPPRVEGATSTPAPAPSGPADWGRSSSERKDIDLPGWYTKKHGS